MNNIHTIITERVDDIPLLLAQMQRMSLPALLDAHFPTHGNWQGLSLGWVTVIWLSSILSEGDHRLNHVEPGVTAVYDRYGYDQEKRQALDAWGARLEGLSGSTRDRKNGEVATSS